MFSSLFVGSFFEEYVPPEGDGLASLVSGAVSSISSQVIL